MLSKRAYCFYLQRAKVIQRDECVVYLDQSGSASVDHYFNIPDKNTSFLLLGQGTSITNSAVRKLAESGVVVGFTGTGGSPLHAIGDITFLNPQDEYRPTEYMQSWAKFWFDENLRLSAAKSLFEERITRTAKSWGENPALLLLGIKIDQEFLDKTLSGSKAAKSTQEILLQEALWAKKLYALLARGYKFDFKRNEGHQLHTSKEDRANSFLDHGNYLAYGLAAVALHGLGISYAFPLLHGKTRRGALVFDIADLIKDAIVMPAAFEMAASKVSAQVFRDSLVDRFVDDASLDYLFDTIKFIAQKNHF